MDPFIGQIMMFGGNFAPRGWAMCDGQLLQVSQYTALYSIIGTFYGGDGVTTFALPDLRGRVSMHPGNGPGLTPHQLGESGGTETVTLTEAQMPTHNHLMKVTNQPGNVDTPSTKILAKEDKANGYGDPADGEDLDLNPAAIHNKGGSQPHNNMQPYQCVNYIIALVGVYPSRN